MLLSALFAKMTVTHIEIGTTFVDMSIWTVFTLWTLLSHEVLAYFQVMTEITPLPIRTITLTFIFLTSFNFAFIMRIWTAFSLPTLPMNKLLTNTISGEFWSIIISDCRCWHLCIVVDFSIDRMICCLWVISVILGMLGIMGHIHLGVLIFVRICHDKVVK